jgi:hypothetical protein
MERPETTLVQIFIDKSSLALLPTDFPQPKRSGNRCRVFIKEAQRPKGSFTRVVDADAPRSSDFHFAVIASKKAQVPFRQQVNTARIDGDAEGRTEFSRPAQNFYWSAYRAFRCPEQNGLGDPGRAGDDVGTRVHSIDKENI